MCKQKRLYLRHYNKLKEIIYARIGYTNIANLGVNAFANTYFLRNIGQLIIVASAKWCFKLVKIILNTRKLNGL